MFLWKFAQNNLTAKVTNFSTLLLVVKIIWDYQTKMADKKMKAAIHKVAIMEKMKGGHRGKYIDL